MKNAAVLYATIILSGCYGMADYQGPPPGAKGQALAAVDPESIRVEPSQFPRFRVSKPFQPPPYRSPKTGQVIGRPMVEISPSDVWHVRHVLEDLYVIVSDSYDQRHCESRKTLGPGARCAKELLGDRYEPQHFNAIFMTKDGRVAGGWKQIANPKRIVLSSERRTFMAPAPTGNDGWEDITFEVLK